MLTGPAEPSPTSERNRQPLVSSSERLEADVMLTDSSLASNDPHRSESIVSALLRSYFTGRPFRGCLTHPDLPNRSGFLSRSLSVGCDVDNTRSLL